MKNFYDVKNIDNSVKDVSMTTRRVKVVVARMGNKDLDGDIIQPGAFNKTIQERGPKGANLIWHLTDHNPSFKCAVGKPSELYVEGNDLVMVTDIAKTSWGNDVLEFYMNGSINQHSIGFKTIKEQTVNDDMEGEVNSIMEVMLFEGSAVLWGANPLTPTRSVGKSMTNDEIKDEFAKLTKEWDMLIKSLRDGKFTDDTFELIEIRINQNQERQKQLFEMFTQPVVDTVEPEKKSDDLAQQIYLLTLKHF